MGLSEGCFQHPGSGVLCDELDCLSHWIHQSSDEHNQTFYEWFHLGQRNVKLPSTKKFSVCKFKLLRLIWDLAWGRPYNRSHMSHMPAFQHLPPTPLTGSLSAKPLRNGLPSRSGFSSGETDQRMKSLGNLEFRFYVHVSRSQMFWINSV